MGHSQALRRAGRSILTWEHGVDLCAGAALPTSKLPWAGDNHAGIPQVSRPHRWYQSNKKSFLPWANTHQLFITLWQKMLLPRRHLLPTPVLKTTLKPDAITLEKNERAPLCKSYYCTIKLDSYTRKEFSWGKNTKYSGQNSHSKYKIKHLIADWRTWAMISNRISTLKNDFFTLLSKIQAEKYR